MCMYLLNCSCVQGLLHTAVLEVGKRVRHQFRNSRDMLDERPSDDLSHDDEDIPTITCHDLQTKEEKAKLPDPDTSLITDFQLITNLSVRYVSVFVCVYMYCTVLYCTVLYCTILYCTILYCTVLYCTVLYCTVLYCAVLYCTVLYCTILYCAVLYCTVLYCTVQC